MSQFYQPQYGSQLFPAPQGSFYVINSATELNNIPLSAGITAILCPSENTLYLKSIPNGASAPALIVYKIHQDNEKKESKTESVEKRLTSLEEKIKSLTGGKTLDELL